MRIKPPTGLRLQCPSCGEPVEVVESNAQWMQAALEPCGHRVSLDYLRLL